MKGEVYKNVSGMGIALHGWSKERRGRAVLRPQKCDWKYLTEKHVLDRQIVIHM